MPGEHDGVALCLGKASLQNFSGTWSSAPELYKQTTGQQRGSCSG